MKIEFTATKFVEGSFALTDDDLDDAKANGIDITDPQAVGEYIRMRFERDGYMDDIVDDEYTYSETEIQEWYAR